MSDGGVPQSLRWAKSAAIRPSPLLNAVVAQDQSPMVRRLAKEALQKSAANSDRASKTVAATTSNKNG